MQLESGVFTAVLALNVVWFSMGFWYFIVKSTAAAKLLVPKSARESPLFSTLAASVRFLGAMNFAFALLAALVLVNLSLFDDPRQRASLHPAAAIPPDAACWLDHTEPGKVVSGGGGRDPARAPGSDVIYQSTRVEQEASAWLVVWFFRASSCDCFVRPQLDTDRKVSMYH